MDNTSNPAIKFTNAKLVNMNQDLHDVYSDTRSGNHDKTPVL